MRCKGCKSVRKRNGCGGSTNGESGLLCATTFGYGCERRLRPPAYAAPVFAAPGRCEAAKPFHQADIRHMPEPRVPKKRGPRGPNSTSFKPGCPSPNPTGRPKIVHSLKLLAQAHTQDAVDALVAALNDRGTRVQAAVALLDRGYGRPVQTQNLRVIRSLGDLSTEELEAIAADPVGDDGMDA